MADELATRFWSHVAKSGDCWAWTGTRRRDGYGVFWDGERQVRAHRWAWESANGPIPSGRHLCHHCDNPPCVRPDHLFVGTQTDNMADMTRKGRRISGERHLWFGQDQQGSKNRAAKLTEEQVAHIKGMVQAGYYHDDIARQFGVTRENVSYIARKTWLHVEPIPYPPFARTRPVGRSAPRKRAELSA